MVSDACSLQVITAPTVTEEHFYTIGAPEGSYRVDEFTYDLATDCPVAYQIVYSASGMAPVTDQDRELTWYTRDNGAAGPHTVEV